MLLNMKDTLTGTRFAVIGNNARHVLPFLSQAGASSVFYYENYDCFDCRNGFDVLFVSDHSHVMACVNNYPDKIKAIGVISGELIDPKIEDLIPTIPIFSSTCISVRSVSEYVIASIFLALRNISSAQINTQLNKEIKGKTLGIIGYGKVGVQVSVLAESLGMKVIFNDSDMKLNIGNSRQILKIPELLSESDVVLLSTSPPERAVLTRDELKNIKHGCSLINVSGIKAIELQPLFDLLQDHAINCLIMDLDSADSAQEANKVSGKLSSLSNVCLTRGELCRTSESLQKISRNVVESVLNSLIKDKASRAGSTLSGEELSPTLG